MFKNNEQRGLPYRMVVFNEVIVTGSFTQAAENLGHTKSAVSMYITQLEQMLGTKLLNRSTRRLDLTAAGQQFFKRCSELVATVTLAVRELDDFDHEPQGRFAITAPHAFEPLLIDTIIGDLCRLYPKVIPHLEFSDHRLDLLKHKLDMAISIGDLKSNDYNAIKLGTLESILVASPALQVQLQDLEDLNQCTFIRLPWQNNIEIHSKENVFVIKTEKIIQINTLPAAISAARSGLGVLLAPTVFLAPAMTSGELVRVFKDWQGEPRDINAVHGYGQKLPLLLRSVVNKLQLALKNS